MGAFHEGHLGLMRLAAADGYAVVVTLFVNPTQFAPTEDLSRYPRDEARDLELAAGVGVDLVFAPGPAEMYPPGFGTAITVAGPSDGLEGASRPDHFGGVATVVAKLLHRGPPRPRGVRPEGRPAGGRRAPADGRPAPGRHRNWSSGRSRARPTASR